MDIYLSKIIKNYINGKFSLTNSSKYLIKRNPSNNKIICKVYETSKFDLENIEKNYLSSENLWKNMSTIERGEILYEIVDILKKNINKISKIVSEETGKNLNDSINETKGAIKLIEFFASEGSRMSGRTLPSSNRNKTSFTAYSPIGLVGLIVPANTPLPNIAWKVFPALICGNTCILKSSENAPKTAEFFSFLINKSKLPKGVFNCIHGSGITGAALCKLKSVGLVSFTGSSKTGKIISSLCSKNFKRCSLELGGKNVLVVLPDCNLNKAVEMSILSAFSNAGQRCSSGSILLCHEEIIDDYLKILKEKLFDILNQNPFHYGPVINQTHHNFIKKFINDVIKRGNIPIFSEKDLKKNVRKKYQKGYFIFPTIFQNINKSDKIFNTELFSPVCIVNKIKSIDEAIFTINELDYGLTTSIHTQNLNLAKKFYTNVNCGVININGLTFGAEPHTPFGGFKKSGNGTREPGLEALQVYSELKIISYITE